MHSLIAATAPREPMHRRPIHRTAAARFPAAFRALFRFPTRTVRKPQEAVILATITACLMVETDDKAMGQAHSGPPEPRERQEVRRPYAPCRQRRIEVGVDEPTTKSRMHPSGRSRYVFNTQRGGPVSKAWFLNVLDLPCPTAKK
jgi:hypothetical protein